MNPEATTPPHPARPAIASLFRYSPALILLAVAIADLVRVADPDLWGHVRFGQVMLSEGHLVWRDTYSYSAPGHLWLNHEWLSELIMGALYNHLNVFGLKLMKLGCSALTVVFIAAAVSEAGAPTLIQFAIVITAAVAIAPQIQFRPQIFTFALLAALIYLLARNVHRRGAGLWLAVPMLAAWANLHGGFILGIASLAIYTTVSALQDIAHGRGASRGLKLGAVTVLATLATLATPYGIGTWRSVLHALRNPYTRIVIYDWQPLMHGLAGNQSSGAIATHLELGLVLMAAMLISFILAPTTDDLSMVTIAAVMSAAALLAVRNLPAAVIAICAPLARHLPTALERRWPAIRNDPGAVRPASRSNQAILVMLTLVVFWRGNFFSNRLTSLDPYPVSACAFMKEHGLKGNVLAMFAWGEYLIWHLAPDSRVFMDGRYDTVHPKNVVEDYLLFNFDQSGAEAAIDKYPTDYVLIGPDTGARKLMDSRKDWTLVYSDDLTRLYARANSPAAHLPGVPIAGTAQAIRFP